MGVLQLAVSVDNRHRFLRECLEYIAEAYGQAIGMSWVVEPGADTLSLKDTCDRGLVKADKFLSLSKKLQVSKGENLAGKCLQEGRAFSISSLSTIIDLPHFRAAQKAGFKSAFALPIRSSAGITGVFTFFSRSSSAFDSDASVDFLDRLGLAIGMAFERKDASSLEDYRAQISFGEKLLSHVIENMTEAVYVMDNQMQILLVNAEGKQLLGDNLPTGSDEEFVAHYGVYYPDKVTPMFPEKMPSLAALRGETVIGFELYMINDRCPQGVFLSVNSRPLYDSDGNVVAALTVAHDITQSRLLQQQLQVTADEASASSRLKSEFVANVSHEIRTPLAGILGMAELLTAHENIDSEGQEIAAFILQSAQNLLSVVNDLLDFSKLEAGKLTLYKAAFSPCGLLREVEHSVSTTASKKGLDVRTECDEAIATELMGDHQRILQVMLNFAHNAVKFTEQGRITIFASLETKSSELSYVRFGVSDTGIGIKEEVQKLLFEPFVQADGSTTRQYGGTGLGLSIARKLTELMSGEIGLESEPGSGSTFWIKVPLD